MTETAEYVDNIEFPEWANFLFEPLRTKVVYGGRGAGRSWNFARALIMIAGQKKTRILCAREFQNSIAESVHRVLSDQIEKMGVSWFFTIQNQSIVGLNGSEFIFVGLKNNPHKVKSTEGVDICWVEEAELVSSESWEMLIPTIRKPNSEIWVSFNPRFATDETYKRYVLNTPPDCITKKVNGDDNPWFPAELKKEAEYLKSIDMDAYYHIYGGECRVHSHAQIFFGKWIVEDFVPDTERWDGPYFGVDFGFAKDPTVMIKCWVGDNRLYIEKEAWALTVDIDKMGELFMKVEDSHKYVIRADGSRPETISYLSKHGYPKICSARKWPNSVEDGIARMRSFEQIVIHPDCKKTADEFRMYSYKTNNSGDILPDIIDLHNHCVDAVRYAINPIIDNTARIGRRNAIIDVTENIYNVNFGKNGWMA